MRTCRIVKLSALKRTHPKESAKLHPRAKEVVLKTPGPPSLSVSESKHIADVGLSTVEELDHRGQTCGQAQAPQFYELAADGFRAQSVRY